MTSDIFILHICGNENIGFVRLRNIKLDNVGMRRRCKLLIMQGADAHTVNAHFKFEITAGS